MLYRTADLYQSSCTQFQNSDIHSLIYSSTRSSLPGMPSGFDAAVLLFVRPIQDQQKRNPGRSQNFFQLDPVPEKQSLHFFYNEDALERLVWNLYHQKNPK